MHDRTSRPHLLFLNYCHRAQAIVHKLISDVGTFHHEPASTQHPDRQGPSAMTSCLSMKVEVGDSQRQILSLPDMITAGAPHRVGGFLLR